MLTSVVASASARNLSISNQNIRATWAPLSFFDAGTGLEIRCHITMEGSFHSRTIAKVREALIGYITRSSVHRPCTGGEAWVHNGIEALPGQPAFSNHLPWHIIYRGFEGTLPNITGIRLLLTGILMSISGICGLASYGEPAAHIEGVANRNTATGTVTLRSVAGQRIRKREGSIFCPESGEFLNSSSTVTLLGTTTPVTITLI